MFGFFDRAKKRYARPTPTEQVYSVTGQRLTEAIVDLLKFFGVNLAFVSNPEEGTLLMGYDTTYGLATKDSMGNIRSVFS